MIRLKSTKILVYLFLACDPGWEFLEHTRQCYKSVETTLTQPNAIRACKAENPNAHLVSIPDKLTNDFVLSIVKSRSWIGLTKISNQWYWDDGTKAAYTNWLPMQPSGDGSSVEIVRDIWTGVPGQWNDMHGHNIVYVKGFVCQYNPDNSGRKKIYRPLFLAKKERGL